MILFLRSGQDGSYLHDDNLDNPKGKGISKEQCEWLRNTLSQNKGKRKIIVMHHPPVNVAGTNANGSPYSGTIHDSTDGSILNNRTDFLNICDSNEVDVVLCGHVHQNVVANRKGEVVGENWIGGTRYVQTGAALDRFFRIINVDSTMISVSYPILSCNKITDTDELKNALKISVFLNPEDGILTIDCSEKALFEILNQEEQIINTMKSCSLTTKIDLSAFPRGIYQVKAITEKGTTSKKIRKE